VGRTHQTTPRPLREQDGTPNPEGRKDALVRLPRTFDLDGDARMALAQILGIMSDQALSGDVPRWDVERLMEVELRLGIVLGIDDMGLGERDPTPVTIGIDDAALLLDGMAYTEIASAEFPWIDMVRWTADFVSAELRRHWTDAEWLSIAAA
jgi:hypothetical protein